MVSANHRTTHEMFNVWKLVDWDTQVIVVEEVELFGDYETTLHLLNHDGVPVAHERVVNVDDLDPVINRLVRRAYANNVVLDYPSRLITSVLTEHGDLVSDDRMWEWHGDTRGYEEV